MIVKLKRKYRPRNIIEPLSKRDRAWKGNIRRGNMNASSNSGTARNKGEVHPIGGSGRTLGAMQRKYRSVKSK